jgi:hypothetical protein
MAHDIFISYSSHDKIVANATCAALEAQRIRCWIAPRDVLPGSVFAESIVSAIRDCRAMVLIYSGHANESPHICQELAQAVDKGKFIVPFRVENVTPSAALDYWLRSRHWLDAITPPLEERIRELVASVTRLLGSDAVGAVSPGDVDEMYRQAEMEANPAERTRLFQRTLDLCIRSLACRPSAELHRKAAMTCLNLQDFNRAIEHDRNALRIDPQMISAWGGIAVAATCSCADDELMWAAFGQVGANISHEDGIYIEACFYVGRRLLQLDQRRKAMPYLETVANSRVATSPYMSWLQSEAMRLLSG